MTIRELIKERSAECRNIDSLGPKRAAEILVELAALLSSLNSETVECNYVLNIKKMELLKEHGSAAKAKIFAEALPEWKDWRDRVMQGEAIEELIRSLKYYLRNNENEQKLL